MSSGNAGAGTGAATGHHHHHHGHHHHGGAAAGKWLKAAWAPRVQAILSLVETCKDLPSCLWEHAQVCFASGLLYTRPGFVSQPRWRVYNSVARCMWSWSVHFLPNVLLQALAPQLARALAVWLDPTPAWELAPALATTPVLAPAPLLLAEPLPTVWYAPLFLHHQ